MATLQLRTGFSWMGTDSLSVGRETRRSRTAMAEDSRFTVITAAMKGIEDVNDEMNLISRQNLDFAFTRRKVRSAFIETQQQLDHLLFKRAPSGIQMKEWYEANSRGLEIFCKSWLPPPHVGIKATVFFCHGYGDTCTFFFEGIAKRIAAEGYGVFSMDHAGFGLSQGLHGYIPSFDELVDDVIEQYAKARERPEIRKLPHFIFGQSMGGAVALKAHLKQPDAWDGVILVAPMCRIAEEVTPSDTVIKIATLLSMVLPKLKLFPQQDLSELMLREPDKRKMAQYNVISYDDRLRARTAIELLKTTKEIESKLEKVSSPLLILHGSRDKVTDPQVSKYLYSKASSKDKTLKLYEGGYHCILEGEPDERILEVINDIVSWLDLHSSTGKF